MSTTQTETVSANHVVGSLPAVGARPTPLRRTHLMDQYDHFEVSPAMGSEFTSDLQLSRLIRDPNADALIQDLAVLISERGVAFFRAQDLDHEDMKTLCRKLGQNSGRPAESDLHIHHHTEKGSAKGDHVHLVSNTRKIYQHMGDTTRLASIAWHSDSCYEPVPSDYTLLKVHTLPPSGGDTLWANGYEVYSRLSPAMKRLLEGCSAIHNVKEHYVKAGNSFGNQLRTDARGHPLNVGDDLCAIHPVIRVNPVTGWKAVFINKGVTKRIVGVSKDESDFILEYLNRLFLENHDLQIRLKWNVRNPEGLADLAVWDNRSTIHTPTHDYDEEVRVGDRVVGVGEVPYYDENGRDRREALGLPKFFQDL